MEVGDISWLSGVPGTALGGSGNFGGHTGWVRAWCQQCGRRGEWVRALMEEEQFQGTQGVMSSTDGSLSVGARSLGWISRTAEGSWVQG